MEIIAQLLVPLEMLFANLFVIDQCSKRKYSNKTTLGAMSVFVVVLMVGAYWVASIMPGFGNGNGMFVFCGFLFAAPIKLLYKNSVVKIVCLACISWAYTFLLFSLSVHIGRLVTVLPIAYTVAIVQTVLYIVTLAWFYRLIRDKFLPMLRRLSEKQLYSMMWMGIIWFWTVFVINLAFVYPNFLVLQPIAMVSVAVCGFLTYRYSYQLVKSSFTIDNLERIAYRDEVTQLRSRALLSNDAGELLERGIPFYLVFMDLDNFKTINDTYGHKTGDDYLAFFAREMKLRVGSLGGFYRIAGDEFVCLYTDKNIEKLLCSVQTLPRKLPDSDVDFLGVSYGYAQYPKDGTVLETLMQKADERMYSMKNASHKKSSLERAKK